MALFHELAAWAGVWQHFKWRRLLASGFTLADAGLQLGALDARDTLLVVN